MNPLRKKQEEFMKKQSLPSKKKGLTQEELDKLNGKTADQGVNTELECGSSATSSNSANAGTSTGDSGNSRGSSASAGSAGGIAAGAVAAVAVVAASSLGLVDIAGLNIISPDDPPPPAYTAVIESVEINRIGNLLYVFPITEESEYFGEMLAQLYGEDDENPISIIEFGGKLAETIIVFDVEGLKGEYELIIVGQPDGSEQDTGELNVLYRAFIYL